MVESRVLGFICLYHPSGNRPDLPLDWLRLFDLGFGRKSGWAEQMHIESTQRDLVCEDGEMKGEYRGKSRYLDK